MSPIGGLLHPCGDGDEFGVAVACGAHGDGAARCSRRSRPGCFATVHVLGRAPDRIGRGRERRGAGVLAFDGDRERALAPGQRAALSVSRDGPRRIDVEGALARAAREGALLGRAHWHDAFDDAFGGGDCASAGGRPDALEEEALSAYLVRSAGVGVRASACSGATKREVADSVTDRAAGAPSGRRRRARRPRESTSATPSCGGRCAAGGSPRDTPSVVFWSDATGASVMDPPVPRDGCLARADLRRSARSPRGDLVADTLQCVSLLSVEAVGVAIARGARERG